MKHVLIVGRSGTGKTALAMRLAQGLRGRPVDGFVTEDLHEDGERLGFWLSSLDGRQVLIAHRRLEEGVRVGSYRINVELLDNLGVSIIRRGLSRARVLIVDELSRLLMSSPALVEVLEEAFEHGPQIVATAGMQPGGFVDQLKRRKDVELVPLTHATWPAVFEELTVRLHALCESDERIAQLLRQADRICEMIVSADVPEIDIEIHQAQLRDEAAKLFPDKHSLYQLLCEGRFRRLWLQFRQS